MECRKILYTYFSLKEMFLHRRLNNLSSICHNGSFLYTVTICAHYSCTNKFYSTASVFDAWSWEGSRNINTQLHQRKPPCSGTEFLDKHPCHGLPPSHGIGKRIFSGVKKHRFLVQWTASSFKKLCFFIYLQWFEDKTQFLLPSWPLTSKPKATRGTVWSPVWSSN